MFSSNEINTANKTSRTNGAIGANAITPRHVEHTTVLGCTILDFGAGKDAAHTLRLRSIGLDVTAYEFGNNVNEVHDVNALDYTYDVVYASNVINVQSTRRMLHSTLSQIVSVCNPAGRAVMNFPTNPRKGYMETVDAKALQSILEVFFQSVRWVGGTSSAPLFECVK